MTEEEIRKRAFERVGGLERHPATPGHAGAPPLIAGESAAAYPR
jgi:hypothetical protein